MASDIIDFQSERGRHEALLGREDVMAEWLNRREKARMPEPLDLGRLWAPGSIPAPRS